MLRVQWNKIRLLSCALLALAPSYVFAAKTELPPQAYAIEKLRSNGISEELVNLLSQVHQPEDRDRIVAMNVLGFLGTADYSGHYSKRAIRKCREFLKKYRTALTLTESRLKVSKEVITALLWVETKHGTMIGKQNVPHVYFSLLQADHPEVIQTTLGELGNRVPASTSDVRQKVIDRSYAKANWALTELKSLDEIRKNYQKDLRNLSGSYAGAFGIPQFIPSSYLQWARSRTKGRRPDLFNMSDAIYSVGYYLKSNGWKPNDPNSHREALFHYNRSTEYVEVILKIARKLDPVSAGSN